MTPPNPVSRVLSMYSQEMTRAGRSISDAVRRSLENADLQRSIRQFQRAFEPMAKAGVAINNTELRKLAHGLAGCTEQPDFRAILDCLHAAKKLKPDDPKRQIWDQMAEMTPAQLLSCWKLLPDTRRRRGRPKGRGAVLSDPTLLNEMDLYIRSGVTRTRAARLVLTNRGFKGNIKGAADHLVRVWTYRAKK